MSLQLPTRTVPIQSPTLYVTALSLADGRCIWRTRINPFDPCYGPGRQTLSITATEGPSEIYVTESRAIRRLDVTNGDLIATGDLGIFEGGVGRGGGWIRAVDDGVIRIGGNGPPEKWTRQLERCGGPMKLTV